MDPVAGEAGYEKDVLHGTDIVPCEGASGPIGQDGGSTGKSSGTRPVGNLRKTMYPIWDTVFQAGATLRLGTSCALGRRKNRIGIGAAR